MKALGYRAVDMLVEHLSSLSDQKVSNRKSRQELEALLREPIPQQGSNPHDLLNTLEKEIFGNVVRVNHPRFFAFVGSPGNYMSALADFLVSGFNPFAGTWLAGSGAAQLELVTIDWLCQIFGLPSEQAGGLFLSGGSMANLTGLIVARFHKKEKAKTGVFYCSEQTHSSIERALRVIGAEDLHLRKIKTDEFFQISIKALEQAIKEDKEKGLQPICIVGNAGTTNTGAIDDLQAISIICERENLWFHVDAAYGGAAMLVQEEKPAFKGIELADSIVIDPHKWFFQPFEIGCLLVRDKLKLKETFHILPEYLKDVELGEDEVNFGNYGLQLTRSFRALKLWLSLKTFGLDSFKSAIAIGIRLAKLAEEETAAYENIELITSARIGVINFRFTAAGLNEQQLNDYNIRIIEQIVKDGFAMISSTMLRGKTVVRLCIINPRTTEDDTRLTIKKLYDISKLITVS